MDRREAQQLLGVTDGADLGDLKRRFRILARDLHPDRGGDPAAFRDVQRAFALLRDELGPTAGAPRRPLVGRGRPSRTVGSGGVRATMDGSLDADARALAGRLVADRIVRLASRAPGALGNRFAGSLDIAATSSLLVAVGSDGAPATPTTARIELTARTRAARRAVTRLDLSLLRTTGWTRQRGDAITLLHAWPRSRDDATTIELLTATAAVELLSVLTWPLEQWSIEPSAH